jgi:hypothetical protein
MSKLYLKRKNKPGRIAILGLLLSITFSCVANDSKYPADAISDRLKKAANVVKRMEEVTFRLINTGEAVLYRKYAITVLNENGDKNAVMVEYYDKLRKIISIEGALYDAAGNQQKKMRMKDALDQSAVDDNDLMSDDRKKVHQFYYKTYPYTVEYQVEIKLYSSLFFPAWIPQEDEHFSVEQSSYTLICPSKQSVRFRSFNYRHEPITKEENGQKIMKWEIKELAAITRPYAAPQFRELTTMVYFAPTEFEIQGYKGNMSSWEEFGRFQYSLNLNRDKLPPNIVQTVNQLTAGVTDEKEKVKILYEYLQKNTRYISIQLGIGGWQPFEASFVAQKGYGDCKGLTNYMYSLLKAAGIKANYTLIYAGYGNEERMMTDFPAPYFNHVVLAVPSAKDTLWLECTSQDDPPGYMGGFTGNRKALMITENGGVVVSTPRYGIDENTLVRNISAKLQTDGSLSMKVETIYRGTQQDRPGKLVSSYPKDDIENILQQNLQLASCHINAFKYEPFKFPIPELHEELDITANAYATMSGKRIFITPNILSRSTRKLNEDEIRTVDYVFYSAWRDEDKYEIEIPAGYSVEAAPQDVSIKTRFGTYKCSTKLHGNKIIYHRIVEQFSGRFPASDHGELAKFFGEIYKSDRIRMVLVKND